MTVYDYETVSTQPIADQKMGTSGLRKRVKVITTTPHYLENFVQSIINVIYKQHDNNQRLQLVVGGDGRYYNKEAIQLIVQLFYANWRQKLEQENGSGRTLEIVVAHNGLMSTPALSAVIREIKSELGGLILTASHNPGGPNYDWGIKYNAQNGGPAIETITDAIYAESTKINTYYQVKKDSNFPKLDLSKNESVILESTVGDSTFRVRVIDSVKIYSDLLFSIFDMDAIKKLLSSPDFKVLYDSMHGITGIYTTQILGDKLGLDKSGLMNAVPLEDFGGGHPDPNLTYAEELVKKMFAGEADFGAASDGDGDRNMVLGSKFFVTPSDSVAIIADYATKCIPYFKNSGGLKGLARSMPTSTAIDRVAKEYGVECYEVPTGWKYFGNLFDAGKLSICGEESFGTGSDHIREKDGMWAVLAHLSILAYENNNKNQKVSVKDIVQNHWRKYGRSFYTRYDFEEVEKKGADDMVDRLSQQIINNELKNGLKFGDYTIESAVEFEYTDPIDHSVTKRQGIIITFTDGSRIIFRLSGTGSVGATVRLYMEKYIPFTDENTDLVLNGDPKEVVKQLWTVARDISQIKEYTGRDTATVIT
jgi:phosphoglucomutase